MVADPLVPPLQDTFVCDEIITLQKILESMQR
jgi:hypothetical protein